MDPFSLTVGIIGIVQAVTSCLKLAKKHVGPSALSSVEAENLMKTIYEFHGAVRNFHTHLELYEDDETRVASLEYLKPVVNRSLDSFHIVKEYLSSGLAAKTFRGSKFDRRLKVSLKAIDDASKLFNIAVLADQQTIMLGVSKYIQGVSEVIDELQSVQLDAKQDDLYRDVRKWLGAQIDNDMNSQLHQRNLSAQHSGSGEWLLSHGTFQNWSNASEDASEDASEKEIQSKLWVKGSPGAGKSVLCSAAINHVTNRLQGVCLYYFYRFDDQSDAGIGVDDPGYSVRAAALLVDQLFRYFWRQDRRIAGPVGAFIETVEKNTTTLAEVVRLILKYGHQHSQEQGARSAAEPIILYLFLDGLDENRNPRAANEILRLLHGLENETPIMRKLWISSRDTNVLRQDLDQCTVINIDDHAEADVKDYLTKVVPKFNIGTERDCEINGKPLDDWILEKLQDRAKGNFLYASLMVERLQDGAFSVDDIMVLITSKVPNNFAEMYRRVFRQYQEDQHKYISLLFSLIAFARRPLHLRELREFMTLAMSDPSKGLDPLKVPMSLQRLFAPLIEMEKDSNDPENPLCRLCHATVHEFLTTNPDVLCVDSSSQVPFTYTISSAQVGDLCLRYLTQQRYSALIQPPPNNSHEHLLFWGDETRQHGLVPYCAKYWDRHLEDLKPTAELYKTVCDFLSSANFQTLLQMQSLFVSGQFTQFRVFEVSRAMHRRVFPNWFGMNRDFGDKDYKEECWKYRRDYRHFVNEWGYLLERGVCISSEPGKCLTEHFWGEVDRCLSGLLGPTNFLNGMKERYPSFMLTQGSFDYQNPSYLMIGEAVSWSNSQFMVISSSSQEKVGISLEMWDLNHQGRPEIVSTTFIPTSSTDSKLNVTKSISFSNGAGSFKFGRQTFDTRDTDTIISVDDPGTGQNFEPISTDFDRRYDIMVVASRNVYKQERDNKTSDQDIVSKADTNFSDRSDSDSSETESDDESENRYSSISESENSAYETCSEGSTDFDSDDGDDETSENEGDFGDELSESSAEETDLESEDSALEDKADEAPRRTITLNYKPPVDNKFELQGENLKQKDDRPTYPGMPGRFRDPKDRIKAAVAVYDVSSGQSVRLFHYEHDIPAMLYDSPPVLHLSKSLVVWPLGGGEVLFADYVEKTYFVRAVMPTTSDTRHICMKARFSPCGCYLHIASLEARVASKQEDTERAATTARVKGGSSADKEIVLSLFLTTHRLSERKTTRSPPRLIHRVKITLGQFAGLSLAKLPFTFTWTPDHLYFSVSGNRLNVFRIELFKPAPSLPPVVVPQLSVMLPLSASCRQVHYLPRGDSGGSGIVLVGSYGGHSRVQLKHHSVKAIRLGMGDILDKELLDYPCPPVGFYIEEERDLGGWGAISKESVVDSRERFRDGKLVRKIESFNWRDDVDLEGICDFCNSPLSFR